MDKQSIRHMVIFNLKHQANSAEECDFLEKCEKILTSISFVNNFQVCKQVSGKNHFKFGFSMEFLSRDDFNQYLNHPEHISLVKKMWNIEVLDFLEIDFQLY